LAKTAFHMFVCVAERLLIAKVPVAVNYQSFYVPVRLVQHQFAGGIGLGSPLRAVLDFGASPQIVLGFKIVLSFL